MASTSTARSESADLPTHLGGPSGPSDTEVEVRRALDARRQTASRLKQLVRFRTDKKPVNGEKPAPEFAPEPPARRDGCGVTGGRPDGPADDCPVRVPPAG